MHDETEDHEVGADIRRQILDDAAPPAIETVGDAQQRRELAQAKAILARQRREPRLGRLRVAPAVVPHQRGEERDLGRREAAQLGVLDEVRRVPVVALGRNVLADVVDHRRELEHLPIVRTELVQRLRLVEEPQCEPGDVRGVVFVGIAPAREVRRPRRAATRADRPTSRRDRA